MTDQVNDYRTPDSPQTAAAAPQHPVINDSPAGLSPDAVLAWGEQLVRDGASIEKVNAALAGHGVAVEPDDRSPGVRLVDETFGRPPASDSGYRPNIGQYLNDNASPEDLAALSANATEFAAKIGFGVESGRQFIEGFFEDQTVVANLSPDQLEAWKDRQVETLVKVLDADRAEGYVEQFNFLAREVGGDFAKALLDYPVSAQTIVNLAHQGQIIARRGMLR